MVLAIHLHGSDKGIHVSPHSEPPSDLLPHPIPLGYPRALTLSDLLHALNLHWSSILHMVITAASQAPLSMAFSRQEYWSGVPLPSPMWNLKSNTILEFFQQTFEAAGLIYSF